MSRYRKTSINLNNDDVSSLAMRPDGTLYPALLTVAEAAELARVAPKTIYRWSSEGKLDGCAQRGKGPLRILRDRFIRYLFR